MLILWNQTRTLTCGKSFVHSPPASYLCCPCDHLHLNETNTFNMKSPFTKVTSTTIIHKIYSISYVNIMSYVYHLKQHTKRYPCCSPTTPWPCCFWLHVRDCQIHPTCAPEVFVGEHLGLQCRSRRAAAGDLVWFSMVTRPKCGLLEDLPCANQGQFRVDLVDLVRASAAYGSCSKQYEWPSTWRFTWWSSRSSLDVLDPLPPQIFQEELRISVHLKLCRAETNFLHRFL